MLRFGPRVGRHVQLHLRTQHNVSPTAIPHMPAGVPSVPGAGHNTSSIANESGSVVRSYRSGISDGVWEDGVAVSCRDQDEPCSGNNSAMQNERIEGQQSAICNPCGSDTDLHADIVSVKGRDLACSAITDNFILSAETINFSEGHKCITTSSTTKDIGNCSRNNCNPGHGEVGGNTKDDIPGFFAQNSKNSGASTSAEASISQGQGQLQSSSSNQGDIAENHDNVNEQLVPPDPETCCGSGCVNCVYIKYVQEVLERDPNDRQKVKDILDQIEDYNVKMFIKMELGL